MRIACLIVSVAFVFCGLPPRTSSAEITDSSADGFVVRMERVVQAPPQKVYRHLVEDIGKWWESSHTYSGDSSNLYLEPEPKGWFGERLPDGGTVQHMEVVAVFPNKLLRLRGALGPMQELAVTGAMTWTVTPQDQGTRLTLTYYVGGYRPGGLAELAQPVNMVLDVQFRRLAKLAETGKPD